MPAGRAYDRSGQGGRYRIMGGLSVLKRWRAGEAGLTVVLVIQIVIMFGVAPMAATGMLPLLAIDLFRVGLAAAAVLLVTRRKLWAWAVAGVFVVSFALSVELRSGVSELALSLERLAATTAFDAALVVVVGQVVFGGGRVTSHRIRGAVVLYLSIGLIFANAYRACALLLHPAFSAMPTSKGAVLSEMLYFSLSTLTTTGFGDIAPVHPFIRSLANLEGVIGQLFPATLLATLVSLRTADVANRDTSDVSSR